MHKAIHLLFFTFFLVLAGSIWAQPGIEWDRTYGGNTWEEGNRVIQTPDGGYLITGYTSSGISGDISEPDRGEGDAWVLKVNALGEKQWDKRYGGQKVDRIWWAEATSTGNFLLVGESRSGAEGERSDPSFGKEDYWIMMIDQNGTLLWDKAYGGSGVDWPFCAVEAPNGDFLITGFSDSPADGNKTAINKGKADIWTIRIDALGTLIWDKTYGGDQEEQIQYIYPTKDGNYFLGGSSFSGISGDKTDSCRGSLDFWLVKIDPDGNPLWDKTYGGNSVETIVSVASGVLGTYWLSGGSASSISGEKTSNANGGEDFWLVQIDNEGNFLNDITYGGGGLDKVYAFYQNPIGNIMIGGISATTNEGATPSVDEGRGSYDYWVIFMKPDGTQIWNQKYGGVEQDALTDFIFIPNDGFVLLGNSTSNASFEKSENSRGMNDVWLIKLLCGFDVQLGEDIEVCPGELVNLNATSPDCIGCQYVWQDSKFGPERDFKVDVTTEIYVTAFSENACEYRDTIILYATAGPNAADIFTTPPSCVGFNDATLQMGDVFGGLPPYVLLEDTLDLGNLLVWQRAGPINLRIQDSMGCILDTLVQIPEAQPFIISLGPDTVIYLGNQVLLSPTGNQPIKAYYWTDPNLVPLNPIVEPVSTTEYILVCTSNRGCIAQTEKRITVRQRKDYFAPSAFSPDHDGTNDYFIIYGGDGIVAIRDFEVFDRWGTLLFSLPLAWPANPDHGWDGDHRNFSAVPGVYSWRAELLLLDGTKEIIYGDVTLIR